MVALQNFLQRIADHPVLSFNKHFYTFLTAKQWVSTDDSVVVRGVPNTNCSVNYSAE